MSTIIMSACWPLQGLSPAQKAVLISLADQANDDGYCWPSIKTIGTRTCLSDRAVQGAIKWLIAARLLRTSTRSGTSTVYQLTPAAYAPPQEMRPADAAPRGAGNAPPPPQLLHPTPADAAPKPSLNRQLNHQRTVIVGAAAQKPSEPTAPAAKPERPAKPAARATVMPADFMPNEIAKQLAHEFGLSVEAELAAFCDHHGARGTTFKDWQAGFRTWLRNASKFQQQRPAPRHGVRQGGQQPQSFAQQDREAGMRRWEEMTGRVHPERQPPTAPVVLDMGGAVLATPAMEVLQ